MDVEEDGPLQDAVDDQDAYSNKYTTNTNIALSSTSVHYNNTYNVFLVTGLFVTRIISSARQDQRNRNCSTCVYPKRTISCRLLATY